MHTAWYQRFVSRSAHLYFFLCFWLYLRGHGKQKINSLKYRIDWEISLQIYLCLLNLHSYHFFHIIFLLTPDGSMIFYAVIRFRYSKQCSLKEYGWRICSIRNWHCCGFGYLCVCFRDGNTQLFILRKHKKFEM